MNTLCSAPRSTLALLMATAGAGALVLFGQAGPASSAPPECQGQPATIVATADGQQLQGTELADVISTGGYDLVVVDPRGGSDLICADAGDGTVLTYASAGAAVSIDAAGTVLDGADTDTFVGISSIQGTPFADTYVGTPGDDRYQSGPFSFNDSDGDDIRTGPGDDVVVAIRGSVRLGGGADRARGYGAVVAGEAGDDVIALRNAGTALGGHGSDTLRGDVTEEEEQVPRSELRLVGGPGEDTLSPVFATGQGTPTCACRLGTLLGGRGVDTLDLTQPGSVVDVATRQVRLPSGTSSFGYFERFEGSRYADVLRGNARPNSFDGLGGDDVLVGRGGADVLIGGRGHDRADGGAGRDRCEAEVRRSC